MLKKNSLTILFSSFIVFAFAQDTLPKASNHYVGVQANQLIRQIFNFSGTASAVSNPYLLIYSVNSVQTKWGANFGLGYTFNEFKDGDAFNQRSTKINDFFFRVGFEKKSNFGKHWILSAGADAVMEFKNNSTTNTQGNNPSTTFKTKNKSSGFGLGPRVTLNYEISDKLMVGTEATYYFKSTKNKVENSGGFNQVDDIEEKFKSFQFTAPAVIFLILKF